MAVVWLIYFVLAGVHIIMHTTSSFIPLRVICICVPGYVTLRYPFQTFFLYSRCMRFRFCYLCGILRWRRHVWRRARGRHLRTYALFFALSVQMVAAYARRSYVRRGMYALEAQRILLARRPCITPARAPACRPSQPRYPRSRYAPLARGRRRRRAGGDAPCGFLPRLLPTPLLAEEQTVMRCGYSSLWWWNICCCSYKRPKDVLFLYGCRGM